MSHGEADTRVDVPAVMAEIKERVRQRKASGFYSEEEIRRIAQMELGLSEAAPGFRDDVEHHLAQLNEAWDTTDEPAIGSHRPGLGPLIVAAKRLLWRVTRPYTRMLLARQVAFNTRLLHLLNPLVPAFTELSLYVHERLTTERAGWVQRYRTLVQRTDELAAELDALRVAAERPARPAAPFTVPPPPVLPTGTGVLPPGTYLAFEDRHRGSREEIRRRQREFVDLFAAGPVLDVGCGRGEFLELCREAKLEARGIERDPAMVARCREAGLEVEEGDALAYLAALSDGSLGGVWCSHVIEHLPPDGFIALVQLAHAKLQPGGVLYCETPNPRCLTVFSGPFYIDLTHIKPIHPEAAVFVLQAAGFRDVTVRYLNPYPPEMRLQPVEPPPYTRPDDEAVFYRALNDNLERLNDILWGSQDYAVLGRKP